MSLAELLKDSDRFSPWTVERIRLKRLLAGALVGAGVLGVAAVFMQPRRVTTAVKPPDQTVQLLKQVQSDAQALRTRVEAMKAAAPPKPAAVQTVRVIRYDPGDGFLPVAAAKEKTYIPTGAVFLAQLITPIKTSVDRTFVLAEVTHEFRMDMNRRIPKRSRLVGRSYLNPVLKGVVVEFDTLVRPDGTETKLRGLALSRNALPEIDGLYFSNDLENYGTALAFGFLSGFAGGAREREITPLGTLPTVNLSNQILSGLSTASFQVAEDILRDIRNRSVEYVVVPAGEQIFVALTQRYEMDSGDKP